MYYKATIQSYLSHYEWSTGTALFNASIKQTDLGLRMSLDNHHWRRNGDESQSRNRKQRFL